ncbi:hypothetical protein [Streptomyces sp. NBC_01306]|uniref:hypothetical protein n=1 Tax=Streptomyces sp. NBC_01306 TaxID=2903819 RepID=UPI002252EEC9|nr:hypothetical protein [Streptomyces sp. NBC_01306]MCX4722965.1 hypothetical protein [Streptomyces sp. NBC_01306]
MNYQAGDTIDLTGRNRWIRDDTTPANEPDRNMDVQADHPVSHCRHRVPRRACPIPEG